MRIEAGIKGRRRERGERMAHNLPSNVIEEGLYTFLQFLCLPSL